MNKKNIWIIVGVVSAILIGILLYLASNVLEEKLNTTLRGINNATQNVSEDGIYTKSFGSYKITDGWEESKSHSTKSKFFYIKKGTDNVSKPDNISVNVGTNRYKEDEHVRFREAIIAQLSNQIPNEKATINANGTTTEKGYIVYEFEIKEEDATTIQYYIVGDYKYVLVHETIFENKEETDKVAKEIINSFTWKE